MSRPPGRHAIVGVWDLVSLELVGGPGGPLRPLGDAPAGRIIYTEDGHLSATITRRGRTRYAAGDPLAGTAEEMIAAARTWTSYVGTWQIEGESVFHRIDLSFFPNWEGDLQRRTWSIEGETLRLSSPPMVVAGAPRVLHLVWTRAAAAG
jgi:hypothetical protein